MGTPPSQTCGGSNGTVGGACMTQLVICCSAANCGVMDMLRFAQFTIGWAWRLNGSQSQGSSKLSMPTLLHNLKQAILPRR